MNEVRSALSSVRAMWREIGIMLGLPYDFLKMLLLSDESAASCIDEVVKSWLKRDYNTDTFGKPSWKKLVEVVGARVGGDNVSAASVISSEHPSVLLEEEAKGGIKRPRETDPEEAAESRRLCLIDTPGIVVGILVVILS